MNNSESWLKRKGGQAKNLVTSVGVAAAMLAPMAASGQDHGHTESGAPKTETSVTAPSVSHMNVKEVSHLLAEKHRGEEVYKTAAGHPPLSRMLDATKDGDYTFTVITIKAETLGAGQMQAGTTANNLRIGGMRYEFYKEPSGNDKDYSVVIVITHKNMIPTVDLTPAK